MNDLIGEKRTPKQEELYRTYWYGLQDIRAKRDLTGNEQLKYDGYLAVVARLDAEQEGFSAKAIDRLSPEAAIDAVKWDKERTWEQLARRLGRMWVKTDAGRSAGQDAGCPVKGLTMEVTTEQKCRIALEILEQIASNSPIPSMDGRRISELEREKVVELCRAMARQVLESIDKLSRKESP